jgi:hypothetical protein
VPERRLKVFPAVTHVMDGSIYNLLIDPQSQSRRKNQ